MEQAIADRRTIRALEKSHGAGLVVVETSAMITRCMGYFSAGRALNSLQVTLLAETLLEDFPHETLSDVALFLRRAAKGEFEDGKTFGAMDIPTVLRWWRMYLEEKAQQVERDAQREKEQRAIDTVQALSGVKGLKDLVDKMAADREERRNEEDKAARIHRLREGVAEMSEQELRDQWALRPYADERAILQAEAARRGMLGEDMKAAQIQIDAAQ